LRGVTSSDTSRSIDALRSLPLFAALDDHALNDIAAVATPVEVSAGHVLMHAGQEGSGLFVLQEGDVVVELGSRTVSCGPGEFLGELALLVDGLVHTGRVRATTPVRCLAISRADFSALLERQPRLAVNMLRVLAKRLADTDRLLSPR
jgi:CRP-like cAMP-binding protein